MRAASRGGRVAWIAPTHKQALEGWRYFEPLASKFGCQVLTGEREIRFDSGGLIECRTANDPDSLRGAGWDLVVMDECRDIPTRTWPEIVRPALMDRQGRALFLSTPRGFDWFYGLYRMGVDQEPGWASWRFPSYDNPRIDRGDFEAEAKSLPERIRRQELFAEFIPDGGGILRNVRGASTRPPEPGRPHHRYVGFYDTALGTDFNAVAVFRFLDNGHIVQVYADRWGEVPLSIHEARIGKLRQYPGRLFIDATGANVHGLYSTSRIAGLVGSAVSVSGFQFNMINKAEMTEHMATRLEAGTIELLDPAKCTEDAMREAVVAQIAELEQWSSKKLPGGGTRYQGPDGTHDDMAVAVMAGAYQIGRGAGVNVHAVMNRLGGVWG